MEHARSTVLESIDAPLAWRLRAAFLREVIAKPSRMRILAYALRFARASGLQSIAEQVPVVGPRAALAPTIRGRPYERTGTLARPQGKVKRRVALLTGCIMPHAYGRVHRATVRALALNGCEVVAPPAQACCGALHGHNGDLRTARELARRNIDAFLAAGVDAVIVNSAGCGAAMKEYGQLLSEDPQWAVKAARFSAQVQDVSEFLVSLPFKRPTRRLDATVTLQDSCHLAHAQRITVAPREVLTAIPGLRLLEMAHPDRCCGSAGVYSLTQPEMSLDLLQRKMADVEAVAPHFIATSNPGCMAQLEAGARLHNIRTHVVHIVELLDRSYRSR